LLVATINNITPGVAAGTRKFDGKCPLSRCPGDNVAVGKELVSITVQLVNPRGQRNSTKGLHVIVMYLKVLGHLEGR
jgi:hypothetical protein